MKALTPFQSLFLDHVLKNPGISAWKTMTALGKAPKGGTDTVRSLQKKGQIKTGSPGERYRANGIGLYHIDYKEPEGEYLGVFGVVKSGTK